ncbi:amino acid ABC transporter substrate-binding protein [Aestuariibacter sp. GS-14]|uniref:substrate-binding periplasmic protein n=1 Tax=Aestuariibacter sp. GS-14 TaxID=2590670 RepID=UPI00112B623A|nr:transporter substrate-binding domain-containing protein [Aestuariibacter sp. GS-14]TPV58322.1 amino acid ABC transporter substrate-binding protein [Aestuariibacter sp. GS-14]
MIARRLRHTLYITAMVFCCAVTAQSDQTLYLAMAEDWKPYVYLDANGKAAGDDFSLLQRTLTSMQYDLMAVDLPEQRLGRDIFRGHVDVTLGAVSTPERREQNYFSIPYRLETIVFAYRKSLHPDWQDKGLEQILQQQELIAVNNSGWFGDWFRYHIQETYPTQLIHAEGTLRRMQLLKMGRVSAVIGDIRVLQEAARELEITDLQTGAAIINQTPVHFMFSRLRVDADFMKRFNQALKQQLDANVKLP